MNVHVLMYAVLISSCMDSFASGFKYDSQACLRVCNFNLYDYIQLKRGRQLIQYYEHFCSSDYQCVLV